jgi:hypothetical protein
MVNRPTSASLAISTDTQGDPGGPESRAPQHLQHLNNPRLTISKFGETPSTNKPPVSTFLRIQFRTKIDN